MWHTAHKQWRIWKPFVEGWTYGERVEREPRRGFGSRAPSGVQGHWWGVGGFPPPLKLTAFLLNNSQMWTENEAMVDIKTACFSRIAGMKNHVY